MTTTDFKVDEQVLGYEITEDGYDIYLDGKKWIAQHEPYIPYPKLGYEGSCLKQIEELCNSTSSEPSGESNIEERVTSLEDMILEMSEILYA